MLTFLIYLSGALLVLSCLLLILLVLMQRPKQEGLGAAFGAGVTDQIWGSQTTNVLQKGTVYLAVLFFGLSLSLTILKARKAGGDRLNLPMDEPVATQAQTTPADIDAESQPATETIIPAEPAPPAETPAPAEQAEPEAASPEPGEAPAPEQSGTDADTPSSDAPETPPATTPEPESNPTSPAPADEPAAPAENEEPAATEPQ